MPALSSSHTTCLTFFRLPVELPAKMYWDLNIACRRRRLSKGDCADGDPTRYDGIVWTKTVTTKLTPKDANTRELPDVADTWKHSIAAIRAAIKHADYHMTDAAAGASAAAASSAASSVDRHRRQHPLHHLRSIGRLQQRTRLHMVIEDGVNSFAEHDDAIIAVIRHRIGVIVE